MKHDTALMAVSFFHSMCQDLFSELVQTVDNGTHQQIEVILDYAESHHVGYMESIDKLQLTKSWQLGLLTLMISMAQKDDVRRLCLYRTKSLLNSLEHNDKPSEQQCQMICLLADALIHIEQDDPLSVKMEIELWIEKLHFLAEALYELGHYKTTYDIVNCGLIFYPETSSELYEPLCRLARACAQTYGNPLQVATCSVRLVEILEDGLNRQETASLSVLFDEFEIALTALHLSGFSEHPQKSQVIENLCDVLQSRIAGDKALSVFKPVLVMTCPHILSKYQGKMKDLRIFPLIIFNPGHGLEAATVKQILLWFRHVELKIMKTRHMIRNAPDKIDGKDQVFVNWLTWQIEHKAISDFVPHGKAILKNHRRNYFLVLAHEITHVYSLMGQLGVVLSCIRATLVLNEFLLISKSRFAQSTVQEELDAAPEKLALLTAGDISCLGSIAKSQDLIKKQQLIQVTLTPWLEGMAVFAECLSDPSKDANGISLIAEVVRNMYDHTGFEKNIGDIVALIEKKHAQAIHQTGKSRLRGYLMSSAEFYWSGLLLVRSVVSTWRSKIGYLPPAMALNLLLHATRFNTDKIIPDLTLDTDTFERNLSNGFSAWIRELANLPKDILSEFFVKLPPEQSRPYWQWTVKGLEKVEPVLDQDAEQAMIERRLNQVLISNLTADASLQEAKVMQSILDMTNHLDSSYLEIAQRMVNQYFEEGSLMMLGHCKAKFVLDESNRRLTVFIPTGENENGELSVNLMVMQIEKDIDLLKTEILRLCHPHMKITRFSDIASFSHEDKLSHPGLNYLNLQYGRWQWTVRGGLVAPYTDKGIPQNVLSRISRHITQPKFFKLDASLFSNSNTLAKRAKEWLLTSTQWKFPDGNRDFSSCIAPLTQDILRLANENLRPNNERLANDVARRALENLWGETSEQISSLCSEFESLTGIERQNYLSAFFDSAMTAVTIADELILNSGTQGQSIFRQCDYGTDVRTSLREEKMK